MNVFIVCVCYNNESDLLVYLKSLKKSFCSIDKNLPNVTISVVNNGSAFTYDILEELKYYSDIFTIDILEDKGNVGYFPGLKLGWEKKKADSFEYIILSNIDLQVADNFFKKLVENYTSDSRIIAPAIISDKENKNRNPKILKRPSRKSMLKYLLLYGIPYFHHFYKKYFYVNKKPIISELYNNNKIYAPHGSFVIFQNMSSYMDSYLSYPIFLFGEEIYIGEISIIKNHDIVYIHDILINDSDHATTSLQKESFIRKNNLNAIKFLYKNFW